MDEFVELDLSELLEQEGYETIDELISELFNDSTIPCMCSCGAWVEPDGHCEHGRESVFLFIGII